jgi:CPA2 family monovalent cation:H+ antiporter-2
MPEHSGDVSALFLELGTAVVLLAVLARIATRWGFSAIPLYLLAGLAFGKGGLAPLPFSESFIQVGAEIGVLLLLFMLGLEYTADELRSNLRVALPSGIVDFVLNFTPGLVTGFLLRWSLLPSILLGGVTFISSSGVIAKVLGDLRRLKNPETPSVLSVLVIEDLMMAVYLPIVTAMLLGGSSKRIAVAVSIAIATVSIVFLMAVRYGRKLSHFTSHESDEVILLTMFGIVLLVAGLAQRLQVSAAVGAFLVGIAISGPVAERSHRLFAPLRDLFAATFFFFFGLEVDPASLPPILAVALGLGIVTAVTKVATGWWSARRLGVDNRGCWRAGMALIARGEFSIVISGLGATAEPQLGPLAAAYVLFLAILGPILTRFAK